MQVTLNTQKILKSSNLQFYVKNEQQKSLVQQNSMELSNFNSIGRSLISFKGDSGSLKLSEKTIEQLEELKKVYKSNQDEIDKKKKAAQANLDKIAAWNWNKEYNQQKVDAENEIDRKDLSRFWNPFKCNAIREKHYNEFHKKELAIDELKRRKEVDEAIISSSPLSTSQVKILIEQIDAMIEQKKQLEKQKIRQEGIDGVQRTINAMFNKSGGLKDRIAGYDYEKDEITKMFVEPLAKSKDDPTVKVPSAVLLHGATGTGKTTFLNGIGEQSKDFAEVVDLSVDIDAEDFPKEVKRQMEKARARYFELDDNKNLKKTRTILLVNEAERFLSMTPEEAKILYGENMFDAMDIEYMENYGQSAEYINEFKSLLDTCSEAPRHINDTQRGALTIFITSNYPHLIHPDLLSRDGKMPFIAINPARNENIEAVVEHYFKKANELVEKIKLMKEPSDIDCLVGITKKAKENIKKMMENGTINSLHVDYKNIPYDKFAQEFNPSMKKGAFSNDSYRKIAEKSCNMYLEDPSHNYEYYFIDNLDREDRSKKLPNGAVIPSGRDINPQRYKKFVSIYNMLAPAEHNEKESLIRMERMNLLDEKAQKRLDYIRIKEASELRNLEEKEAMGTLSEDEQIRLKALRAEIVQGNEDDNEDDE